MAKWDLNLGSLALKPGFVISIYASVTPIFLHTSTSIQRQKFKYLYKKAGRTHDANCTVKNHSPYN